MMERVRIFLDAEAQTLHISEVYKLVEKTVNYIEAEFTLDENWQQFDIVTAIWSNGRRDIATVIPHGGLVKVPSEVLQDPGLVRVNLVGSEIVHDELIERLTTAQKVCITVKSKALVEGEIPEYITPAYIEQLVALAEQAAGRAGFMFFEIVEGRLMYHHTDNTEANFYIENGHLYLEV